jgi:predicted small metal-binding protein
MTRQVRCECGYVARDESDEAVVDKILDHIAADHPDLAPRVSRADVVGWIEIVPA